MKKYTIIDCHQLATQRGGKCLSQKYINSDAKLIWECAQKHQWQADRHNIQRGRWCAECSRKKRHTIEDCQKLAQEKNGKCLSRQYANSHIKLLWECEFKHQWCAQYNTIQQGRWCPLCAGKAKHTIEDCKNLAEKHGGRCLSSFYENSYTKLLWECENHHQWKTKYTIVQQGYWCPECCFGKSQKQLFDIIKICLPKNNILYNFRQFNWLKNINRLELDIYIPELKLAIEYDGKQHFEPVKFWGREKTYTKIQQRDDRKNKLISEHPEDVKHFIRIPYWEAITEENVKKILADNNVSVNF